MRIVLFLTLLFSITQLAVSAQINISGTIVDIENKGLDLALVALMKKADSTFVKSEFSDIDGSFQMTNVEPETYLLHVSLLGYAPFEQEIMVLEKDSKRLLNPIILELAEQELDAVTVTAKLPYIERKIDRTVINVDALISNAGSDALEVLERAPGISLDNNGGIMLKGRAGVRVFINDKPSYLSGTELESYLRSLPAGSIKQIEIMTNPPAKYEAAGNSGVINIITKRNKLVGFNGNIVAGMRQGKRTSSNNSLNLNFNKNKVSLYANISGGFWNNFQDLTINRYYKNDADDLLSSFSQNSFINKSGVYLNAKTGLDYYLTGQTAVGFSYKRIESPAERNTDNNAVVKDAMDILEQRIVAENLQDNSFGSNLFNFYVNHKIDSLGSSISFDADYVTYGSGSDQKFSNFLYDNQEVLTFQDQINGDIPSTIKIYAAKSDYTKPLKDGAKIEGGLKSAFTKTDNETIYSVTIDEVTVPDYNLSNRFLYEEWINAGYLNYSNTFGAIAIQAGLRLESTNLSAEQIGNVVQPDTSFTRLFTQLFPTFFASWKLDSMSNQILTFSYGRRIDRPYFQDLNPFISPLDKFTFYSGNPNLLPTFSHNFSLAHTFKSKITTTLNYAKTIDAIRETLEIRDGIYYSRPGNIASNDALSISVEGSLELTKWYNLNAYLELGHLIFDSELYTEQLNSRGTYYYLSATNSFQFGKGWSADLSGLYRSDFISAQLLIKGYGVMNFGIQKKILDNAGNIKLAVNDFLYTRRGDGIINNLQLTDADWNSVYDTRTVSLALSYRFGKSTLTKQKYQSSGSESEQRRVRS